MTRVCRPALLALVVLLTGWAAVSPPARGAGWRDFADSWLLETGEVARVLAGAAHVRPAREGGSGWRPWAGAGSGRLFAMPELPQMALGFGVARRSSRTTWVVTAAWERLGRDLSVEDTGEFRLRLDGGIRVGIRLIGRIWNVASRREASSLEVAGEFGGAFNLPADMHGELMVLVHPGGPPRWHGPGSRRMFLRGLLRVTGGALAIRLDRRGDGVPVVGAEFVGRLSGALALSLRIDPDTGTLGGGLAARTPVLWLRTAHLIHPVLGPTHRVAVGTGEPTAAAW